MEYTETFQGSTEDVAQDYSTGEGDNQRNDGKQC